MKLNKKIKWTLGMLGMAAITTIPMSVALVSCSKGDDNSLINDNFVANMQDLNKPFDDSTTQEQYNKIKLVANNWDSKNISTNLDTTVANEIANNWLNNATQKQIEDMLLINFNRASEISTNKYENSNDYNKQYTNLIVTNYDNNTHLVDFEITQINSYLTIESQYKQYLGNDQYIEIVEKVNYEFKNIKLVPASNSNIPLITIDTSNPNIEIKMQSFQHDDNYNEYFSTYIDLINYAKDNGLKDEDNSQIVEGEYYNQLIKNYNETINLYSHYFDNENDIINFNWNKVEFDIENINNLNLDSIPFILSSHTSNSNEDPYLIGVNEINNDNEQYPTFVKAKYSIPYFAIAEFNSDNSDFNIVLSK